jgi:hypothetical protein
MPKLRYQPPERLQGAADLTPRPDLRGSLNTVKLVKSQPWAGAQLRAACDGLESRYSRKREPGRWELAAVAFVSSGHVDVEPWYDESTPDLWRECGFNGKPSYSTVYRRFRELEKVREAFLEAAGDVIKRCRAHDPRVLAHVHFDSTEDETHAALIHDCQPGDPCKRKWTTTRSGKRIARRGSGEQAAKLSTGEARQFRQDLNELDPADSAKAQKKAEPEKVAVTPTGSGASSRPRKRVKLAGCWYRTRDAEAGIRAYVTDSGVRKCWHGYYAGKAIDHLTGGVIPSVDPCNVQEFQLFPALFDRVRQMAGATPETVIGDRGYSVEPVFEHVTRAGAAPVLPWRANKTRTRHDEDEWDRHGVMRCKFCGGPTHQIKFSTANNEPRLWFRCINPATADCGKEQTISCSKDWRSLIPLARTEELYHELKASHKQYEAAHDRWRDRYKVAADNLGVRPKALGLDWHRLRANVACLVEWMRIAAINDWLGSTRPARRKGVRRQLKAGADAAKSLKKMRATMGLLGRYGAAAKARGLGEELPPSRRPRGAPPPPTP